MSSGEDGGSQMAASSFALIAALAAALCARSVFAQGELYTGSSCTTNDNLPGVCALYSDCPWAQAAVSSGLRPSICAFDGFTPVVCCEAASVPTTTTHKPTTTRKPTRTTTKKPTRTTTRAPTTQQAPGNAGKGRDKARAKCQEYGQQVWRMQRPAVATTPFVQLVNTSLCRIPQLVDGLPFVIGGKDSKLNEFPHMAAVGFGESDKKRWLCGGALVSERYVVTAGHCIEDKSKPGKRGVGVARWVRLGDLNLYSEEDNAKVQEFSVAERMTHPDYVDGVKNNDIGLLLLDKAAVFDEAVRPVCLHTYADALPTQATASGWGAVSVDGHLADLLQKIDLPLVSQETCRPVFDPETFPLYKPSLPSGILDSMLCAGGEPFGGRDTCQGDSGGPLQVIRSDPYCTYTLVGVTSFGKSCAKPDTPAVYTRVAYFVEWIESIVWP